jgi:hypothetical protein
MLPSEVRRRFLDGGVDQATVDAILPPPEYDRTGSNKFLEKQLENEHARLARIYGFSYEGHYYGLAKPAIFLVHTEGQVITFKGGGYFSDGQIIGGFRSTMDKSGVAAREWEFSGNRPGAPDLRYWEYDKGDFSIRLDIETGPFEQILLEAMLRPEPTATSGATLRSGATLAGATLSGATLGIGGGDPRNRR